MHDIDYKIVKNKLYEDVAEKLEMYILQNSNKLGEKLPSEQNLAESFNVSRPVIREAMKLLRERQLIRTVNGEGTYITKPGISNLTDLLYRMIHMDGIHYSQVLDMRQLLEPYACKLTAERNIDNDSIEVLNETIEKMINNEHNPKKRVYFDLQFHVFIAVYSGNLILASFIKSMNELLTPIIQKALVPKGGHQSGIEYHRLLVQAFKEGNGNKAENIMREHLAVSAQNYLKSIDLL